MSEAAPIGYGPRVIAYDARSVPKRGVSTWHEEFAEVADAYELLRDANDGEFCVKAHADKYLPRPPALLIRENDPMGEKYRWLLSFARFPELLSDGIGRMQGIVHQKPPKVVLPKAMEYLLNKACPDGKTLDELYMHVTREVFQMGSIGLLPEVKTDGVYLCCYAAERIINWRRVTDDTGVRVQFVVLHEPTDELNPDGFSTMCVDQYRVLRLLPDGYWQELWKQSDDGTTDLMVNAVQPSVRGNTWPSIPFVRINADGLDLCPSAMPMLPVAQIALNIYQESAGFHRAIYLKEDPLMMRTGISTQEAETMSTVGGMSVWTSANPEAKAFYVEPTGDVLKLAKEVMDGDYARARDVIGKLIDDSKGGVESGDALRQRRASNSISLASIMRTVGLGMLAVLKQIAIVVGANPDEIEFEPNLDFTADSMTPKDALDLVTAKNAGFPISLESMHDKARSGGLTRMTFEDEISEINDEDPTGLLNPKSGPNDPTAPPDPSAPPGPTKVAA